MNVVLSTLNSNTEPAQHLNLWDDEDIGHLLPVLPNIASEDILSRIFAHSSHHASEGDPDPMQKLELLGDSVLKLVLTRLMLEMYPGLRIGQICTILASLVCNTTLAKISVKYKLPDRLKVQDPGSAEVIRSAKNPQADVFESYIGGLYEDQGGIACVQTWLEALYRPFMTAAYKSQRGVQPAIAANAKCTEITDAVNHVDLLTKYLQRRLRTTQLGVQWEYGGGGSKGRPLEMWSANLFIGGEVFGSGQGPTKKVAENAAAKQGLARMGIALWCIFFLNSLYFILTVLPQIGTYQIVELWQDMVALGMYDPELWDTRFSVEGGSRRIELECWFRSGGWSRPMYEALSF
ncbi:ribonuclease III domain-containing protein [Mycena vulgaris]|nr:ribonuclease III domain-containing protein [Mycena vulgaris]